MAASRYRFDMLARAVEGVQERTVCGALVTVGSVMIIAFLVLFEVKEFLTVSKVHHIGVDDGIKPFGRDRWTVPDQIPVELKMTFAHIECDRLSLEIDATRGDVDPVNQVNFRQPTRKELEDFPLATPETACTLDGHLTVGKVSANFYVQISDQADGPTNKKMLPLALQAYANQMISLERRKFVNISHRVHALHFGERVKDTASPLDGVVNAPTVAGQQHYLIKVIPTLVDRAFGHVATNQYSLAEQFVRYDTIVFMPGRPNSMLGVYFYYDFFPVMIQVVERRPSLAQFLVSICAIVGGVFAASSIVDGIIFQSAKVLATKKD